MTKGEILDKVRTTDFTREKLISWLETLPKGGAVVPSEYKVGDVYMHPIFKHPAVLLEKREDEWVCGLLTTEEDCPVILEECQSRFFNGYFTKVMFTTSSIDGYFISVYNNPKHLREVLIKLKELFK